MAEKKTQPTVRIVEILESQGQIDNFTAIHTRLSLRLGARIWNLKQLGWDFAVETDEHKNTFYRVIKSPAPQ
jgi:hypothetical protein